MERYTKISVSVTVYWYCTIGVAAMGVMSLLQLLILLLQQQRLLS